MNMWRVGTAAGGGQGRKGKRILLSEGERGVLANMQNYPTDCPSHYML